MQQQRLTRTKQNAIMSAKSEQKKTFRPTRSTKTLGINEDFEVLLSWTAYRFYDPGVPNPRMEMIEVPVHTTWQAMEQLQDEGLVRNIGISNFNCQGIRDVMSYAKIKPAVLQVELHPYLQQPNLVRYAQTLGIHVTAFSPMGHGASYWNDTIAAIREPIIKEIAKKHGKYFNFLCETMWYKK